MKPPNVEALGRSLGVARAHADQAEAKLADIRTRIEKELLTADYRTPQGILCADIKRILDREEGS